MTAPVFTSATTHQAVENTFLTRYRAMANDPDGGVVTYSITGGADASFFEIDSASGVLNFKSPPDDENNIDADGNGIYLVEITATDDNSPNESSAQTVAIEVIDDTINIENLGSSSAGTGNDFRITGGEFANNDKYPPITLINFTNAEAMLVANIVAQAANGNANNFSQGLTSIQTTFDFSLGLSANDIGNFNLDTSLFKNGFTFQKVRQSLIGANTAGRNLDESRVNSNTGMPFPDNTVVLGDNFDLAATSKIAFTHVIIHEFLHETLGVHEFLNPLTWNLEQISRNVTEADVRADPTNAATFQDLIQLGSGFLGSNPTTFVNNEVPKLASIYNDRNISKTLILKEILLRIEYEEYVNNDSNPDNDIAIAGGYAAGQGGIAGERLSDADVNSLISTAMSDRKSLARRLFNRRGEFQTPNRHMLAAMEVFRKHGRTQAAVEAFASTHLGSLVFGSEDVSAGPLSEEDRQQTIEIAGELGRATGTQISNTLGIENPLVDFIADVGLTTLTENFAEYIKASSLDGGLSFSNFDVLNNLPVELAANVNQAIDARQGQISDYLTGRFLSAIAVNGFAGHLIGTFSDVFLNNLIDRFQIILTNIADPNNPDQDDAADDGSFFGVVIEDFKTALREDAEVLLESELNDLLDSAFGTDGVIADFADAILDPLVDFGVDTVLDYFRDDNDEENLEALRGAFTFSAIKTRVVEKGKEIAAEKLTGVILDAVGIEGSGIAAQFGRALTKEVVETVISIPAAALGVGEFEGLNFNSLLAQIPNLAGTFVAQAVVNALGVDGEVGDLLGSVLGEGASALTSSVLNNVFGTDFDVTFDPFNLVANFAIGKIGDLVAFNAAGQLGADIGGTIGSLVGTIVPGIGPILGRLIGTVLGGLIGSLFGTTPRAGADLDFNPVTNTFSVGASFKKGKGDRDLVEGISGQVAGNLNDVLSATGGVVVNPDEIVTGHFGQKEDYLRFQLERGGDDHRFSDASELVSFGTFVALENAKIAGGDVYVKRALNATLEAQKSTAAFTGVNGLVTHFRPDNLDQDESNDLRTDLLLGNIATALEYSEYIEDPTIVNSLITAYDNSPFAAGWVITLQQAIELGLHRRHVSDWYGGFGFFIEDQDVATGSLEFVYDSNTNERLITFTDENGDDQVVRDYVNPASKDLIEGNANNNVINIVGATLATNGNFRVNGAVHNQEDLEIDVAAVVRGGAGNDTIRGGDRGNDLFGEDGNDLLEGGATADYLSGGTGSDTLRAVVGDDGNILSGDGGNDLLQGAGGSDWLEGGSGRDTLQGGAGADILAGGAGNNDQLAGGSGNDTYIFRRGDGVDRLSDEGFEAGEARPTEQVFVTGFDEDFEGLWINAINQGYIAQNWSGNVNYVTTDRVARGGEDTLSFGDDIELGHIRLRRSGTAANVGNDLIVEIETLNASGQGTGQFGESITLENWFDVFNRIEWLEFASGQRIRIGDFATFTVGTGSGDVIIGTSGRDFVHGGDGNDVLLLRGAGDIGIGGRGFDFVSGDGGDDIIVGGNDADQLLGGRQGNASENDALTGDSGNDILYGDIGNDTLVGGIDDDTLAGGAGDDIFRFARGDGQDVVIDDYQGWTQIQEGNAINSAGFFIHVQNGVEQIRYGLQSNPGAAEIVFDGVNWNGAYRSEVVNGQDRLFRTSGTQTRNAGQDTIEFAIGIDVGDIAFSTEVGSLVLNILDDDREPVSSASDGITLLGFNGTNTSAIEQLTFFNTGTLALGDFSQLRGGSDGDDTLTGGGWLTGGGGNDSIVGSASNDLLVGHGGSDTLTAGTGEDTLIGGSGDDHFFLGGGGHDVVVGGEGFDWVNGSNIDLLNNSPAFGALGRTYYVGVEGVVGTADADTLRGDDADNELIGNGGADFLNGRAGDDVYVVSAENGLTTIQDQDQSINFVPLFNSSNQINSDRYRVEFNIIEREPQRHPFVSYIWEWKAIDINTGQTAVSIFISDFINTDIDQIPSESMFHAGFVAGAMLGILRGFDSVNVTNNGFAVEDGTYRILKTEFSSTTADAGTDIIDWATPESLSNLEFTLDGNDLLITVIGSPSDGVRVANFNATNSAGQYYSRIEELALDDGLVGNLSNLYLASEGAPTGGSGDDLVIGTSGVNELRGNAGNDVISSGGGNDTIHGHDGDDTLEGGAGADLLKGNGGSDTARYAGSAAGVNVNLQTGIGTGGEAQGDRLEEIENLTGSTHADTLDGNADNNAISGNDGNDTIRGQGGNDLLGGDAGNDRLEGGAGADTVAGGEGADVLFGGSGNDILNGDDGNDNIDAGTDDDFVAGGDGNDTITGSSGSDTLSGDSGNDSLRGGNDADELLGGDGVDTLRGDQGDDVLYGGAGNDVLHGNAGNDLFIHIAGEGRDTVYDSAEGGRTNRVEIRGFSSNQLTFRRSGNHLEIRGPENTVEVLIANYFSASDLPVEILTVGDRNLYFFGVDAINNLANGQTVNYAGIEADWRDGFNEAPTNIVFAAAPISEAEANGFVVGVAQGVDTENTALTYGLTNSAGGRFAINAETGEVTVANSNALDFESANEYTITIVVTDREGYSYSQDFTIDVTDAVETIQGTQNRETLRGGVGDDSIVGNGGGDRIYGAAGNDTIEGGNLRDTVTGDAGDDVIYGFEDRDYLHGNAGNDSLFGGAGNDLLYGYEGADYIDGGDGIDYVSYHYVSADTANGIQINLSDPSLSSAVVQEDTIVNIERYQASRAADTLVGNDEANFLDGGWGNDTISGGGGNDTLQGGNGNDTLHGGDGGDVLYDHQGDDHVFGGAGNDRFVTFGGSDIFDGGDGFDYVYYYRDTAGVTIDLNDATGASNTGVAFGDVYISIERNYGGRGDDLLIGNSSNNDLHGHIGNDVVRGNGGADTLFGHHGTDTLEGGSGNDVLYGGNDNDQADGGAGNDRVDGQNGDDTLTGGAGNDTINGGNGIDVIVLSGTRGDYTIEATGADYRITGPDGTDLVRTSEIVRFAGDDEIISLEDWLNAPPPQPDNRAPSDITFSGSVSESASNGAVVGDAGHVDPDNDPVTYALTNNAGGRFAINANNGVVSVANAGAINFEAATSHLITIRVTDDEGLSRTENFTINVINVNEAPTDIVFAGSVSESAGNGTVVGDASHSDPENNGIRYSLTNNAGGRFAINANTGVVTVANAGAINHESATSHQISIRVTDDTNLTRTENFTINVTNVNEAPTDIVFAGTVSESAGNGTVVGDASHSDPENNGIRYSLTNNAGGRFAINATTGVVTVANAGAINYESATSHQISIRVTDNTNLTRTENFTINVTNVNEAPTDIVFAGSVSETAGNGAVVGDASHSDPENNGIRYSLTNNAGGRFAINATTGVVTVANAGAINYESATAHQIAIRVTDNTNLTRTENFTVNVVNVNEAPTDIVFVPTTVSETAGNGTVVGDASHSDPENNGIRYSLTNNAGGRFAINATTGVVTVANAGEIDYESATSHQISIRVTDNTNLTRTENFTVNVSNVEEAPVITRAESFTHLVNGTLSANTVLADVDAIDPEGLSITYSLVSSTVSGVYVDGAGRLRNTSTWSGLRQGSAVIRSRDPGGLFVDRTVTIYFEQTGPGGGGPLFPVALDLDGDGLEFTNIAQGGVIFDANSDGTPDRTAWVSADDGLLVLDRNGDGIINNGSEISFIDDLPGAQTDLEGLSAFDTNSDGIFDASDTRFSEFQVWQDINQDGISQASELITLQEAGISSINLSLTPTGDTLADGADATVLNTSFFTRPDGSTSIVGDVAFQYENADGGKPDNLQEVSQQSSPVVTDIDSKVEALLANLNNSRSAFLSTDSSETIQDLFDRDRRVFGNVHSIIDRGEYITDSRITRLYDLLIDSVSSGGEGDNSTINQDAIIARANQEIAPVETHLEKSLNSMVQAMASFNAGEQYSIDTPDGFGRGNSIISNEINFAISS